MCSSVWCRGSSACEAGDCSILYTMEISRGECANHEDDKESFWSGGTHGPDAFIKDTKALKSLREGNRCGILKRESLLDELDLRDGALTLMP